jgi:hypothetical protein
MANTFLTEFEKGTEEEKCVESLIVCVAPENRPFLYNESLLHTNI